MSSRISVVWGTALFRNLTWMILAYYVSTVLVVGGGIYYMVAVLGFEQPLLLLGITLFLTAFMGMIMAALALEPLREHFMALERFSKETLHELNLPINTITANTAMLKKHQDDPKTLKRIGRIEMAAEMLRSRYDELNYLIQRQMHKEDVEVFDLKALLQKRIAFVQGLYGNMEFALTGNPLHVRTDRRGLEKVIDNLVENAVKYSGTSRRIDIGIKGESLLVSDYGRGMDEVTLLRIFDRYYQNDATMPGFGIGLGLVKSYCDRNKIGLHVKSKEGEGTTVMLDFKEVRA